MKTALKDMKKRISIITVLCIIFTLFIPISAEAATPKDISGHWAHTTIQDWINKGFIAGYPDGTFRPDNDISRAEFMALINKAFGYTAKSSISFSDVKSTDWFYNAVSIARAAGYIGGYPDGTMRPKASITREEAAVIIMKINSLPANEKATNIFRDASSMGWSKASIGAVCNAKIMNGYPDGNFKPQNSIKRGEAVVSLNNAATNSKELTAIGAFVGAPIIGVELTAGAITPSDATADYQWTISDKRNGTYENISKATKNKYTPIASDEGKYLKVVATGTGSYFGTVTSIASDAVAIKEQITSIDDFSETPKVGVELTAGTIKPAKATVDYQWIISNNRSGTYENIAKATKNKYTPIGSDKGKYLKVVVTGTGGYYGTLTSVASKAVDPQDEITAIGAIVGTPKVGIELTAGTITPSNATAGYQWMISDATNGTYKNITGATKNKYTPIAGDKDKYLKVVVTGTGGYVGSKTSAASGQIVSQTPITNIGIILGTPKVGVELTAGVITPSDATVAYQWTISTSEGGVYTNIVGATTSKYTPVASDLDKYLKVVVTGTGGYSGTKTSDASAKVAPQSTITSSEIFGVTKPVAGAVPVTKITDTDQYKGTVTWSPSNARFAGSQTYTAIITLIAEPGYTLTGVTADFFKVAGATTTNLLDSGMVTAAFPATDAVITAFDAIANIPAGTVSTPTYATSAAAITALSAIVTATSTTTGSITIPVIGWTDTDSYNPTVAGSYTFTAVLGIIPPGFANPDSRIATVEVVIAL